MNRNYKKIVYSFILVLALLFIPTSVQAKTPDTTYTENSGLIINRNFTNKISDKVSNFAYEQKNSLYLAASVDYCNTLTDVKASTLKHMYNRDSSFTINYKGNFSTLKNDLSGVINDIEKSDDYLALSYSYMKWDAQGYDGSISINFVFNYLTTKPEENYIDQKVTSVLGTIIKSSMNDDDKEKAIHDYIVKSVTYDTTNTYYSAYDALYRGTTVCQGYALLAYKMLKQAGINTRIVTGSAAGDSHAWNLVYIRGKWYQLDCTWDDPIPDVGQISYDYYNINDTQMALDHTWDKSGYPEANSTYVYPSGDTKTIHVTSVKISPENLSLKVGQSYALQASILPQDATNKNLAWYSSDDTVVKVDQKGKLNAVSEGTVIITVRSEDGNLIGLCKVTSTKNFSNYKIWQGKSNVPLDKTWTITFKSDIDANSITARSIYIFDETGQNKLSLNTMVLGSKVLVTPNQGYTKGHSYYLVIEKSVLSITGKQLSSPVIMRFKVS